MNIRRFPFRGAKPAALSWNLAKTFMQIVLVWGVLLWILPLVIVRVTSASEIAGGQFAPWPIGGWTMLLLASGGGFWSGLTMARDGQGTPLPLDHANSLVISGPYAFIRNPMVFTGLVQGTAVALILGSWAVVLYVAAGGSFWNWVVRPLEEDDLVRRFGQPYERYRREVRCWVPRAAPYRT